MISRHNEKTLDTNRRFTESRVWTQPYMDLLFAMGMRVGEVSSLDVQYFFMKDAVFRVQGKGGRHHLALIVDDETMRIRQAYMEARLLIKTGSKALFINESDGRLSTHGIMNVIARLRKHPRSTLTPQNNLGNA